MKTFETYENVPGMNECRKRPIIVHAKQINEPFRVKSLESDYAQGKPGDYLMRGIKGELYICDKSIFEESYNWLPVKNPLPKQKLMHLKVGGHAACAPVKMHYDWELTGSIKDVTCKKCLTALQKHSRCPKCGQKMWPVRLFPGKVCNHCKLLFTPEHPEGISVPIGRNPTNVEGKDVPRFFKGFHGANPTKVTKIQVAMPEGPVALLGRLERLDYIVESTGQHKGVHFTHKSGDIGERTIKSNTLVVADSNGTLFLVKEKANSPWPRVSERGILG